MSVFLFGVVQTLYLLSHQHFHIQDIQRHTLGAKSKGFKVYHGD